MKRVHVRDRQPSTRLKDTHQKIVPSLGLDDRFFSMCWFGFHRGIIHPASFYNNQKCGDSCRHFVNYNLPYHDFDQNELYEKLERMEKQKRNSYVLGVDILREYGTNAPFLLVLDHGTHLHIPRRNKLHLIEDMESDHFKLYLTRNGARVEALE